MITIIISIMILMAVFCLIIAAVDCNRFIKVEYTVLSDKLTKSVTLVLLTDLHNKCFGHKNEKLIRAIDEIAPDGILIGGDMLTAEKGADFTPALELMESLKQKDYPIYYGMGNHEYRLSLYPEQYGSMYDDYMNGLQRMGIDPIINERVYRPEDNIVIYGASIDKRFYKRFRKATMQQDYLPSLFGEKEEDKFRILIAHNPAYFEEYAEWGPELVVSGHVHGGIMRLPWLGGVLSPNITFFPKYDGGKFTKDNTTMILSRGLGTHTIPVRIFNPGELVVIHLDRK